MSTFLDDLKSFGFKSEITSVEYQKEDIDLLKDTSLNFKLELIIEDLLNMQRVLPWHKIKDHNGIVSFNFPKGFQLVYSTQDLVLNIRKDKVNTYCVDLIYNINHANAFMFISMFLTIASLECELFKNALLEIYSNFVFLDQPTEEEILKINQNLLVHN